MKGSEVKLWSRSLYTLQFTRPNDYDYRYLIFVAIIIDYNFKLPFEVYPGSYTYTKRTPGDLPQGMSNTCRYDIYLVLPMMW